MNTNFSLGNFLKSRPKHPLQQFVKYAVCGGFCTALWVFIIFVLRLVFPDFIDSALLTPKELAWNTNVFNTAAFIPCTLVAYYLNRALVFEPGRHRPMIEFGVFLLVSLISYVGGVWGTKWAVQDMGLPSYIGNASFAISSALINFVFRKFIIFKG